MKVYCVLFLVLLNTIENQGDPNHGLKNLEAGPEEIYIVSMRNDDQCHICTGTIISKSYILTSLQCSKATNFLHGLREYANCTNRDVIKVKEVENRWIRRCKLYKVTMMFVSTVELFIPPPPSSKFILPQTGAVIGWSFDNGKRKFVMKEIAPVNLLEVYSGANRTLLDKLCEVGKGSPLIYSKFIYGILACNGYCFDSILDEVQLIHNVISNDS